MKTKVFVTLLCLGGTAVPTRAQQRGAVVETGAPVRSGGLTARAVRAPTGSVQVDGRLREPVWATAPAIGDFVQRDPEEGQPASERSEARVLYTDDALYVGFRAWDANPDGIRAVLTRRDGDSPSDWLLVAIDSYHDRRTASVFAVNPAGVKLDFYLSEDNRRDDSWDAVWDVAVSRDAEGWTAEFRIPFSQLRFAAGEEPQFGFQLVRLIRRRGEEDHWRLMPRDESGVVSRFGDLVGLEGVRPRRRLEALPYIAGTSTREPGNPEDPFWRNTALGGRAGVDLTVGLSPAVTLSATVNPDFGQVEADPAVVNLTVFETFFPEQRPFFLEGVDLFRFPISLGDGDDGNEALFYTRRIGRAPQGAADSRGGYAATVGQSTILGAAKVSGKTRDGWSVGILGAMTAEEAAQVADSAGGLHRDIVEPRAGYFVGRLARDFRDGATQVGFFGTAVLRDLPGTLTWLRESAYAGGLNWTHRFGGDSHAFEGWIAGSHVRGASPAIALTQQSSARYFGRPDAAHVRFDSSRTALTGLASQVQVARIAGAWRWAAGVDTRSPGFEVNDVGYQRDADRTVGFLWLSRRWLRPGRRFRRVETEATMWSTWSYGWERIESSARVNAWFQFSSFWEAWVGTEQSLAALDPRALRGGPAIVRPYGNVTWIGVESDNRRRFRGGVRGSVSRQPESGRWGYEVSPSVGWRPASNVDIAVAPALNRRRDTWQYLATVEPDATARYLFGDLRQTTVALTLRADVTFAPTLSLQAWMQPFVSSGDYTAYRQVVDPRGTTFADRFELLGPDRVTETDGWVTVDVDADGTSDLTGINPDFTYLSLRSNVVLRWEYALGSTLFLVWQHGRAARQADGQFDLGRGVGDLWGLQATNTLVLKLNYWLSL